MAALGLTPFRRTGGHHGRAIFRDARRRRSGIPRRQPYLGERRGDQDFKILSNATLDSGSNYLSVAGRYDNIIRSGSGSDVLLPGLGFDTVDGGGEQDGAFTYMVARNQSGYSVNDPGSYFASGDRMVLDYSTLAADASVTSAASRVENGYNVHYRAYAGGDVVQYDFLASIFTNSGSYTARGLTAASPIS